MSWHDHEPVLIATASPRRLRGGSRAVLAVAAILALGVTALFVAPLVGLDVDIRRGSVSFDRALDPGPVPGLADHELHSPGRALPPAQCELPDLGRDTAAETEAYARAAGACLDTTWAAALTGWGLPHTTPALDFSTDPDGGGCDLDGSDDVVAWYCSADRTIHLPIDRLMGSGVGGHASAQLFIVAHEYAHHVQGLTGVLTRWYGKQLYLDRESEESLLLERRGELQANCLAGMFLGAAAGNGDVARDLADAAVREVRYGAASQTHGAGSSRVAWTASGYERGTTDACNTWAAPADTVR